MAAETVERAATSITPSIADLIVERPGTCGGRPRIAGRRITVENIAVWRELGQVHAALAHYFENREAIDRCIREGDAMVESLRLKTVC